MRNLTVCMIAFAVAFSICGVAFRVVAAASGRTGQMSVQESFGPVMGARAGGGPVILDDELY